MESLATACKVGDVEQVKKLLADPDPDVNSGGPLSLACREGHLEVMKLLLADPRVDVNHCEPLCDECHNKHPKPGKLLLSDPSLDFNVEEKNYMPLSYPRHDQHREVVKFLLNLSENEPEKKE
jgi:ankyrin repeat protein